MLLALRVAVVSVGSCTKCQSDRVVPCVSAGEEAA